MSRIELEAPENLHEFVYDEIRKTFEPKQLTDFQAEPDGLHFDYTGKLSDLLQLQTVTAAYVRLDYRIPRPKALLGHQHFQRLLASIETVRDLHPTQAFNSFFLSAAGSDSSVMRRIKAEISANIGLDSATERGDLLIRLKRTKDGWVVLVRISPRPLAVRSWRVCDMEGALNGPIAQIMMMLSNPFPQDVVVNLMCGSGTILIQCAIYTAAKHLIGLDNDINAITCARHNLANAAYLQPRVGNVDLIYADVTRCPLPTESADVLLADLPFGSLVGSHNQNVAVYPAMLKEAARIAKRSATFALITHEINLIRRILPSSQDWTVTREIQVSLRGLNPLIFVLQKSS